MKGKAASGSPRRRKSKPLGEPPAGAGIAPPPSPAPAPAAAGRDHAGLLQQVQKRVEELTLLYALGQEITALEEPGGLMKKMVLLVARALDVQTVSLMLVEHGFDGELLRVRAAVGLPPEAVGSEQRLGEGVSGWVARTGKPVLVADVSRDARFEPSRYPEQYRTGSLLCVPLVAKGRVIGVLNVNNKRSQGTFEEDDLRVMETFAGQAALALDNARLYGRIREHERRLEQEVARKTLEYDRVFDNITSGVLTIDKDARITRINRAGAETLGRAADALVGRYLSEIVGPDANREIVEAAFQDRGYRKREITVRRGDGRDVPIGFSTDVLVGDDHAVEGAILLFRDLTEINEAKRMDRLASLGVMAAGIAHEIKNPLTAIRFGLEFLQDEVSARGQEELGIIGKNIERVDSIVNNLLRISRPQKTEFRALDLNDVLRGTLLLVKKQCDSRQIEVVEEMAASLPEIWGDENQVQQVLLNIALNAIQSLPAGGRLTLRTRAGERPAPKGQEPLRFAVAEIEDNGPGIPPDVLDYIFHPFVTTKETGTGLGLSISHRIVQDHEGLLQARNAPAGGAVFTAWFPAAETRGGRGPRAL